MSEIAKSSSFEQVYFLTNLAHFFELIDSQVEVELEHELDEFEVAQELDEVEVLSE